MNKHKNYEPLQISLVYLQQDVITTSGYDKNGELLITDVLWGQ